MPRPELSLVIPIYNEEEVLPRLDERLKELLGQLGALTTEVVFVNDGSKDRSMEILRRLAGHEPRYRVIGFSRNFGHQRAITAGMDKSRGRAVVVMDADLQDPPEVILEMVEKWKQGFDVVYGRRRSRDGESWFKLFTAKWFYRIFAALIPIEVPLDAGDFRLMSRRVVRTLAALRENHRFVRGLVAWVGFKQTAVEYDRARRAAGETKYPLKKMIAFAIDGIASFSIQPLRFATYVGVFVGAASVLYAAASIVTYLAGMNVPGWTTTVVLVTFLFSVQFFMLGVLGEYVGRIYEQSKRRPLYIVSERVNFTSRRRAQKLATNDLEEVLRPPSFPPPSARTPSVPPALPNAHARTSKPPSATTAAARPAPGASAGPGAGAGAEAKPTSQVPPPPAAVVAAGAAAEASISSHMPARKSVTPAPPAASNKPPPLKLSSSLSSIPVAPPAQAAAPGPASGPRRPSFASLPPPLPEPRTTPSAPPVAAKPTPSAPPVAARPSAPPSMRTPSAPPVAAKPTPSAPPAAAKPTPSAPPVARPSASEMRAAVAPPASVSPSGPPRAPSVPAMRAAAAAPRSDATPETTRSPSVAPAAPAAPTTDEPSDV